jgi:hypothetical protein
VLADLGQHPALDLVRLVDVDHPRPSCALLMSEPAELRVSIWRPLPDRTRGIAYGPRWCLENAAPGAAGMPRRSRPRSRRERESWNRVRRALSLALLDAHIIRRVCALRDPVRAPPSTRRSRACSVLPLRSPPDGALILSAPPASRRSSSAHGRQSRGGRCAGRDGAACTRARATAGGTYTHLTDDRRVRTRLLRSPRVAQLSVRRMVGYRCAGRDRVRGAHAREEGSVPVRRLPRPAVPRDGAPRLVPAPV